MWTTVAPAIVISQTLASAVLTLGAVARSPLMLSALQRFRKGQKPSRSLSPSRWIDDIDGYGVTLRDLPVFSWLSPICQMQQTKL